MPAMIQGYRPDPRVRQTQLAELRRVYGEVVKQQQGAIVFLAGEPGSGRHATLAALAEALRQDRSRTTVLAGSRRKEADSLNSIGAVYAALGEKQQALAYYEQAMPLWRQVGDKAREKMTLANLGILVCSMEWPAVGFKLVLRGATLLAEDGFTAPPWLSKALETQTQQLGYDKAHSSSHCGQRC